MSYNKQTWTTGDTITADKLNHMEAGINTPTKVKIFNLMDTGSGFQFDVNQAPDVYNSIWVNKDLSIVNIMSYDPYEMVNVQVGQLFITLLRPSSEEDHMIYEATICAPEGVETPFGSGVIWANDPTDINM